MLFLTQPPHAMQRHTQVLLVMDVVESVRLMEQDQDNFVRRWQQLVQHVEQEILPRHGGHIIKSMGDGLMLAFASPLRCAQAAYALLNFCQQTHAYWPPAQQMHLRMGCHLASFVADRRDIYGTDVNLTARLCTLAGPGDIVVSADIRHRLVPGLDAEIEYLGERYLKHVRKPVHAYRIAPPGVDFALTNQPVAGSALRAAFAAIPMTAPQNTFPG
jgi:class 3 adenylate cyclase